MAAASITVPSESWDDDFVFQRAKDLSNVRKSESDDPRWSMSTSQDWRAETLRTHHSLSSLSQIDAPVRLQDWAEPGPSTPPKHTVAQTENWDDDFEDKSNSPARQPPFRSHHRPSRLPEIPEPENWDDDLDANKFASPRKDHTWDSSDDEDGIDFADQEDKTVRPRKSPLNKSSPPPPVPHLPLLLDPPGQTFPGSPTMSVFSIPSAHESTTYSSLAHLPLRGGSASALAMLPPSPPAQKPRRRLRKKSRPPDNDLFELLERRQETPPLPSSPQSSSPLQGPANLPLSESSNSSRPSILSRLGSVKRWGVRKRFASPGPSDATEGALSERDATPRAAALQAQTPSRTPSWFFRSSDTPDSTPDSPLGSATLELKHERSFRHLRAFTAVDSPTKKGRLRAAILGERSHDSGSASTPDGSPPSSPRRPRRPKSLQVSAALPPPVPRHASYGTPRSVSRSTPHTSTEDVSRGEGKGKEKEGHRGFMSGVRRISLVPGKKHKRAKSSATVADADEAQLPSIPQIPPPLMDMTPSISSQLLPPIELQPPSPPREKQPDEHRRSMASERSVISSSGSLAPGDESLLLQPSVDIRSMPSPPTVTPRPSLSKSPGSPQSASLGRATQPPPTTTATGIVPRRNSLGDLKIPARISQAQVGLKRDLGMVREFASEIESLKELQSIYQSLAVDAQTALLERRRHPPRATSPTFFNLPRPRSRARSNTSPNPSLGPADPHKQFAASFFNLDHKYKISWECAELLIELGGGPPAPTSQPNMSSLSSAQQLMHPGDSVSGRRSRERAITLAGDEAAPPFSVSFSGSSAASPPSEWRASTGRNDLSQRQLWLLRDMLNTSDSSPTMLANLQIPEEGIVNRSWRWGEATSSTITLPSEDSARNSSPAKKRRYSRLGMSGLRDMLRSLTRGQQPAQPPPVPVRPPSSASTSASSTYDDKSVREHSQHRSRKSSNGREDTPPIRASSPFSTAPALTHKSPRRPSIASIFRFAQRGKPSPPTRSEPKPLHSCSSGSDLGSRSGAVDDEEDWDHIDSAEDLDAAARALGLKDVNGTATVRGRRTKLHPYQPEKKTDSADASQSSLSLWAESPSTGSRSQVSLAATAVPAPPTSLPPPPLPTNTVTPSTYMRPTRLSNVEETAEAQPDNDQGQHLEAQATASKAERKSKSPRRTSSRRGRMTGSVRSAPPPTPLMQDGDRRGLALSLTPETIRPLLENAREVHARCTECVDELRTLLAARPS